MPPKMVSKVPMRTKNFDQKSPKVTTSFNKVGVEVSETGSLLFQVWVVGWWMLKLKLMLTQILTELELELGLSLAKVV